MKSEESSEEQQDDSDDESEKMESSESEEKPSEVLKQNGLTYFKLQPPTAQPAAAKPIETK